MRRYRLAAAIITVFVALVVGLSAAMWAFSTTRAGLTTALILPDLFVDLPISPLKLAGAKPVKEEVTFPVNGRQVAADLYRPDDNDRHGAMLVVIGAAPRAPEDGQAGGRGGGRGLPVPARPALRGAGANGDHRLLRGRRRRSGGRQRRPNPRRCGFVRLLR